MSNHQDTRWQQIITDEKNHIAQGITLGLDKWLNTLGMKSIIRHGQAVYANSLSGNRYEISIKLVSEQNGAREVVDTDKAAPTVA